MSALASQLIADPAAAGGTGRRNNHVAVIQIPTGALDVIAGKFPEVTVAIVPPEALQPEFIRLPKAEPGAVCPVTGLPRSSLLDLLRQAGSKNVPVRQIKKKGATNGIVLIPRQKLVDYINTLPPPPWQPEGGEETAVNNGEGVAHG